MICRCICSANTHHVSSYVNTCAHLRSVVRKTGCRPFDKKAIKSSKQNVVSISRRLNAPNLHRPCMQMLTHWLEDYCNKENAWARLHRTRGMRSAPVFGCRYSHNSQRRQCVITLPRAMKKRFSILPLHDELARRNRLHVPCRIDVHHLFSRFDEYWLMCIC